MDLIKYLTFFMIFFLLGIWGIFLNRKNILIMLMSIELKVHKKMFSHKTKTIVEHKKEHIFYKYEKKIQNFRSLPMVYTTPKTK
jgi:hypothetical protein